jgi:hypothetical protein
VNLQIVLSHYHIAAQSHAQLRQRWCDAGAAGLAIWDADPGTNGRELQVAEVQVVTQNAPDDVAHDAGPSRAS